VKRSGFECECERVREMRWGGVACVGACCVAAVRSKYEARQDLESWRMNEDMLARRGEASISKALMRLMSGR
jgi:hypothetical protein